jgi:hypothetical protein
MFMGLISFVHLEEGRDATHELKNVWVIHIEAVAAAGKINIPTAIFGQTVIGYVVDAAHGQRRASVVSLRGVVVNDIENHLEAFGMQRADHRLKLLCRPLRAAGRVTRIGREVTKRIVSPTVNQSFLNQKVRRYGSGWVAVRQPLPPNRMGPLAGYQSADVDMDRFDVPDPLTIIVD